MAEGKIVLSDGEYRLLKGIAETGFREGSLSEASRALGIPEASLASLFELLASRNIVVVETREERRFKLTDRGVEALQLGLPEERLLSMLEAGGGSVPLDEAKRVLGEQGLAAAMRGLAGLVKVSESGGARTVALVAAAEEARRVVARRRDVLASIAEGREPGDREALAEILKRRLAIEERVRVKWVKVIVDPRAALENAVVGVGRITADMIADGSWARVHLVRYNVAAEPPRVAPARLHFLQEFIEELRDVMKEMGFREATGPLIEIELFNFDLLFQPQDHPAREIHDTLRPALPPVEEIPEALAEKARRVHERGWGYAWSESLARRRVMRSQMTSVSARVLSGAVTGTPPGEPMRYFSLGRVFRRDAADARHLPEFHQLDGIEGWSGYTFRDLLGTLKEFAERIGLEVKFKPAYFPFTEPSIEGYARLPNGQWLELFGAGLFRPEVLEMAGVNYPVGAWGMGVERLAAAYYGVTDIRELYSRDVMRLRLLAEKL